MKNDMTGACLRALGVDMTNLGGPNAGQITAAHFLEEFVGGKPWAHIDIAGTAQLPEARGWRSRGATGFGSRLLVELACAFETPPHGDERAPGSARARGDG
jgi:leucyl aminopeptidase